MENKENFYAEGLLKKEDRETNFVEYEWLIVQVEATSLEEAKQFANEYFNEYNGSYLNGNGNMYYISFISLLYIHPFIDLSNGKVTEIYSLSFPDKELFDKWRNSTQGFIS